MSGCIYIRSGDTIYHIEQRDGGEGMCNFTTSSDGEPFVDSCGKHKVGDKIQIISIE